ncbi:cell division protein FtsB [Hamadaea flava]|uniref:Septum formation initiator family protein n=1 Tax=Hamadaea flava TaxID=1742688 RepID=A0ABV8LI06_9ACTN|nr:septum formation initiator family protein [Hamadaea flava]MCP2326605.1 cell division protein FtsB [Hamadaea flava]
MTQRRTPSGQGPARRSGARITRSGRSAARPATARRTVSAGAAARTTAKGQRRLTGRAVILLVVLVALALAYVYPLRVYFGQQDEISALQADQARQRAHIAELEQTRQKWDDPEYVRIQARRRLFYVRPGEVPLVPIWAPEWAAREAGVQPEPAENSDRPWYETLWGSVGAAGSKTE